ncbi:MAG: hypothetical protein JW944_13265 [Deltaproteobacteria bacterium]|nr:hypothetical protein [Deltaproteobacteria bacterium]
MAYEKTIKYSAIVLLILIIAYLSYSLITGYYRGKIETAKKQEQAALQEKSQNLEREVANLEEEINELKGKENTREWLEEIFGKGASRLSLEQKNLTYDEIEQLVMAFFAYIDERGYVKKNKLTGSACDQYLAMENDLSANVPITSGETENLYNLLQNTAHFFRVLGKERVYLVKDVLTEESDIIEFGMKLFYVWYTYENDNGIRMKEQPSLEVMYDYAAFFMNSLGGKSYLLRRDSGVRILTGFYSVLIIDSANDNKLNTNGIDIRPFIKTTCDDMTDYMGLFDKREYLGVLEKLKIKYNISD